MPLQIPAMKEDNAPSKEHARVFHQLLGAIEAVRITRQEEYREKHHPQLKRFTQQELNDEACPTYKNWLIGRSNRLPSRSLSIPGFGGRKWENSAGRSLLKVRVFRLLAHED